MRELTDRLRYRHPHMTAAALVTVACALAGLIVWAGVRVTQVPVGGDALATVRAQGLRASLLHDVDSTLAALPPWVSVRVHDPVRATASSSPGVDVPAAAMTLSVPTPTACPSVRLTLHTSWVLHGNLDGVHISEVAQLPAGSCAPVTPSAAAGS